MGWCSEYQGKLRSKEAHHSMHSPYIHGLSVLILASHNEQLFQVGLLDRALISLGLALSPPSTSVSSDFMVLCKCLKKYTYFTLPCLGEIGLLPVALTNYCPSVRDTVGSVIWPVKIVPDMTYNVFGGTLNPTLPIYLLVSGCGLKKWDQRHCMGPCGLGRTVSLLVAHNTKQHHVFAATAFSRCLTRSSIAIKII